MSDNKALNGWKAFEEALIYERYSLRDPKTGNRLEKTFEDVANRVSDYVSTAITYPVNKKIIDDALSRFIDRKFTVATPGLMNLGNQFSKRKGYYSCFPLGDIPDNTNEILKYHETCVKIFQYAGGVGLGFSKLRSKDSFVDNGQGVSSGPTGFIPMFESSAKCIAAGGKRRGAMMGQKDWNHPDATEFIELKRHRNDLTAINLSLNVFGDFWEHHDLINLIAECIWEGGDPGLLFTDEMMNNSPYPEHLKKLARFVNP